ncbi:MAG: molybdopterin-dependent oxidoreductase [Gemmataceae bacterium]
MADSDRPADQVRAMTRRAFGALALGAAAAGGGWWWLRAQPDDADLPWPLRAVHGVNERVGRALFSPRNLAPEFPAAAITDGPRVNGSIGRPGDAGWPVRVETPDGPARTSSVARLLAGLPRAEHVTELKCIEGWSQVVRWGGVRFADAAARHGWPVEACPYVGLETPDGGYQVGLDTPSAMHPQTLLCDTMNGEPLPEPHGGPLRVVIPVKYGIKNLKWLGVIRFGTARPADYWAARGYDWYAGL